MVNGKLLFTIPVTGIYHLTGFFLKPFKNYIVNGKLLFTVLKLLLLL